jgi:hypothetical protein
MNEFTAKSERAFLDACGAIGVETNAMEEAQDIAKGIDRMIGEGGTSWPSMYPRPTHSWAPSDTAFGSSDRANLKPGPG